MSDDLSNKGGGDRARINVHERHEVAYWTKALGCSEQELAEAVKQVGVMAEDVRALLDKRKGGGKSADRKTA